jgi:diguanylate cyclase (GGDEF)-like protein/PAS domain S-box-containing protein/putative nucleotidyltransferase with HDIG domain
LTTVSYSESLQPGSDIADKLRIAPSADSSLSVDELARLRATAVIGNALAITDPRQPDNPIIYANAAFHELTGYPEEEIIGFNCRFLQGPMTDRDDVAKLRNAIKSEQPIQVTLLNYRKDGTTFWNELTVSPVRDDHGNVTHFVAVQTEVTALKETEAALKESELGLKLALYSGGLGSMQLKVNGNEFITSDIFRCHFGLPRSGAVTLEDVFNAFHPLDRKKVQELHHNAIKEGKGFQTEARVIWPDTSEHWLSLNGTFAYNALGQIVRLSGVTQDITARKQEEANLVEALRDAEERADRDPLTGLLNHRAFHKRLQEESARAQRDGTRLAVMLLDIDNFNYFNDAYGHIEGDSVLVRTAGALRAVCRTYDTIARFGGDEFAVLMPGAGDDTPGDIETRVHSALSDILIRPPGTESLVPITLSVGASILTETSASCSDVLHLAEERLIRIKTGGAAETEADVIRASAANLSSGFSMLDSLVTAVDNKDRYTRTHSEDVMKYSLMIARELGLDEAITKTVAVAALLHDVGKIGVPDAILRKPGNLTDAEFEAIKQHPVMGAVIVTAVPGLEATIDAIRHHHERWDGKGYPQGLSGLDTPLIARLMAVADAYSAMSTNRPYRAGMAPTKAQAILQKGSGIQWDPDCVTVFLNALNRTTQLSTVETPTQIMDKA